MIQWIGGHMDPDVPRSHSALTERGRSMVVGDRRNCDVVQEMLKKALAHQYFKNRRQGTVLARIVIIGISSGRQGLGELSTRLLRGIRVGVGGLIMT
jgi:hypothetical protein